MPGQYNPEISKMNLNQNTGANGEYQGFSFAMNDEADWKITQALKTFQDDTTTGWNRRDSLDRAIEALNKYYNGWGAFFSQEDRQDLASIRQRLKDGLLVTKQDSVRVATNMVRAKKAYQASYIRAQKEAPQKAIDNQAQKDAAGIVRGSAQYKYFINTPDNKLKPRELAVKRILMQREIDFRNAERAANDNIAGGQIHDQELKAQQEKQRLQAESDELKKQNQISKEDERYKDFLRSKGRKYDDGHINFVDVPESEKGRGATQQSTTQPGPLTNPNKTDVQITDKKGSDSTIPNNGNKPGQKPGTTTPQGGTTPQPAGDTETKKSMMDKFNEWKNSPDGKKYMELGDKYGKKILSFTSKVGLDSYGKVAAAAAASIALWIAWRKFKKSQASGVNESVSLMDKDYTDFIIEDMETIIKALNVMSLTEGSGQPINMRGTFVYPDGTKKGILSRIIDKAMSVISSAIQDKEMPDEVKAEFKEYQNKMQQAPQQAQQS